jgi:predicted lactoylglutathione lyase
MQQNLTMDQIFMELQQEAIAKEMLMNQHYQQAVEGQMAHEWNQDFVQNELLRSKEGMMDEAFEKAKEAVEKENEVGKEATDGLISLMMSDPDPKFKNSKFLDFLKQVNTGHYEITDSNELIVHPEKANLQVSVVSNLIIRTKTGYSRRPLKSL